MRVTKFFCCCFVVLLSGVLIGAYLQKLNKLSLFRDFLEKIVVSSLSYSNKISDLESKSNQSDTINTHYYNFTKQIFLTTSTARYGGIDKLGNNLIFIDGEGKTAILKNDQLVSLSTLDLPNNRLAFFQNFKNTWGFGILDLLFVPRTNGDFSMYVSALDYNILNDCYFISIWSNENRKGFITNKNLKKIYSTTPCVGRHQTATSGFAGTSAAGKLASDNGDTIFLSTGDFYFDGVNDTRSLGRATGSDYGKILKFSIKDNRPPEVVAIGLRNPEGLFYTSEGIFETEHGPQGGDELNFIPVNGKVNDYGWPFATFGVNYGTTFWPLDLFNDNHFRNNNVTAPVFSWLPSIGVSNLIRISESPGLERWKGNLLVSSLKDESLYRIIMDSKNSLHGIERIPVDFRIRDLVQIGSSIYLLEDSGRPAIWRLSPQ